MSRTDFLPTLLAVLCIPAMVLAQEAGPGESTPNGGASSQSRILRSEGAAKGGVLALLPADSTTEHSLDLGPRKITYQATAGTLSLFGQDGQRSAEVFYTSYIAENGEAGRPLTFVFNGGPGAASAFLHLGLVGPRILDFGPTGRDGATAKLVDNPQSWLGFSDLVLIDPIGTGWSRTAKPDDAKNFYGVRQDAAAVAKTIALYLAHNGRASSPKYLLGESYGGLRAVKVAKALQQDQGIIVSGLVMLSPLLEGPLQFDAKRFALGASLQLPSLAAAEMERRNAFSSKDLDAAELYARTDYLAALAGPPPVGPAAQALYDRVAQLTGLPVDIVRRTRGFVREAFVKHLQQDKAGVVSPYDITFTAPDPFPESDTSRGDDPILDGFVRAYGGAFVGYARDQLGYKTEMTYTLLADDINGKWDWSNGRSGGTRAQVSVSDDIRELLSINPAFRIMVAHGYSDLVTPYAVNKYVVDHLPENLSGRVFFKVFRGGHMFYTAQPSRIAFSAEAGAFYNIAVESRPKD